MNFEIIQKSEFDRIREIDVGRKYEKLQLFADMCRYNTFVSVKKAGSGHLGSSLSAMDIVTYLYLEEMNFLSEGTHSKDRDIYFSSKGHDVPGLYAVFYALGILDETAVLALRRLGGLDGHPEVRVPGIEANSGSLGMGISKGKGMAWAKNYKNNGGRIFVLTGDGEFQEGQIYESLQSAAHQNPGRLTVIIDRNKFQTDMQTEDVNAIENIKEKVEAFDWHVLECSGHDFKDIEKALNEAEKLTDKPRFIIADTVKGKGISFLEAPEKTEDGKLMYKWHSGAPDDIFFKMGIDELKSKIDKQTNDLGIEPVKYMEVVKEPKKLSNVSKEFVKIAFGEALLEQAENRRDLIVMDGDLSADCGIRPFETKYPERFIENGIAEQDMVSSAGGLARQGLLPVVNSFASFLASRANEQIYNNACENTKIIYAMHFSGIIPAGPGKSHQSVRDISLMGAIPNMLVVQPCNAIETKMLVDYCVNKAATNCCIRLIIGPSPREIKMPDDYRLAEGRGAVLRKGKDAVVFGYGPVMLHEALTASELLQKEGFGLKVVNMPWLNRIDAEWVKETIGDIEKVFILEDHSEFGGLGTQLVYSQKDNLNKYFEIIGLKEYPECGTPTEVLRYHRLDGMSLAERMSGMKIRSEHIHEESYTADAPQ